MTFFLSATIAVVTDEITQRRQFSFKNPLLFIKFHFIVLLQNIEELERRFWAVCLYFFQYLEFWNRHLCFMSLKLVWLCSFYWFFFFFSSFLAYLYSLPLTSTLDCCPPLSISGKAHRLHLWQLLISWNLVE